MDVIRTITADVTRTAHVDVQEDADAHQTTLALQIAVHQPELQLLDVQTVLILVTHATLVTHADALTAQTVLTVLTVQDVQAILTPAVQDA